MEQTTSESISAKLKNARAIELDFENLLAIL